MTAASTVRIDDDLASGQAGVALRAADDEASGWIDVKDRLLVEVLGRNGRLDDSFDDRLAQSVIRNVRRGLRRDDDGGGPNGPLSFVLDRHLRFAVGAQKIELARLAQFGKSPHELVRQRDRQ